MEDLQQAIRDCNKRSEVFVDNINTNLQKMLQVLENQQRNTASGSKDSEIDDQRHESPSHCYGSVIPCA